MLPVQNRVSETATSASNGRIDENSVKITIDMAASFEPGVP